VIQCERPSFNTTAHAVGVCQGFGRRLFCHWSCR
jgi:hypothetical protein